MSVDKKSIQAKLTGFLTGEISKSEIYEWALSVAVSSDYEKLLKDDKLIEQIFQFLIDIEKPKLTSVPTKKVLEYFIHCLEGKNTFIVEDFNALMGEKNARSAAPEIKNKTEKNASPSLRLGWLVTSAKVYALIFIVGSILLNSACVLKPDILVKPNEIAPSALEVGKQSLPHLFYGVLILLAMSVKVPRMVFLGFIPAGIWGMFFYWSFALSFAIKQNLGLRNLMLLLLLIAMPPTAAFFVLLNQWFNQSKIPARDQDNNQS